MSTTIDNSEKVKYAESHEWVRVDDDGTATVGISDFAQQALGDIVYVELPPPGTVVSAKEEVAVVESVKSASDIYSPVSGEVLEANKALLEDPGLINSSPHEEGWLFRLRLLESAELDDLLDAEDYAESHS